MQKQQLMLIILTVAVVMLGTATKLQSARNIKLQGAVSGGAKFDGSGDIVIATTQANIAVLTGNITLSTENGSDAGVGTVDINYPIGFDKNNCVVISIGAKVETNDIWGYGNYPTMLGLYSGAMKKSAYLKNNNISLNVYKNWGSPRNDVASIIYNYKLVLMKIS